MIQFMIAARRPASRDRGFTLIELLIVVAIIGILAAIAVPNYLLAQTRAKVARVRADMQTLATALEFYFTDYNHYPYFNEWGMPGRYNEISYRLIPLTTPEGYLTRVDLQDPFLSGENDCGYGDGIPRHHYNYRNHEFWSSASAPSQEITVWILNSIGPDQAPNKGLMTELWARGFTTPNFVTIYDPTNGTVSSGDMPRTGGDTRYQPAP